MARALWKGAITFGLVNIPVELYPAVDQKTFKFSMLDKRDLTPVCYKRYSKTSGKEVPWEDIVKGYEYEKDQYVVLSDEDFRRANLKATQTIAIEAFVDADEIPAEYFESPYYLAPAPRGEKVYALLRETLKSTHRIAVAQVVIRTAQHLAAVMPHGRALMLITLRYQDELRPVTGIELPADGLKSAGVGAREVALAKRLVDDMTERWNPAAYKDTYHSDLMARISQKIKAGETKEITKREDGEEGQPRSAQIIDLAQLLQKSLGKAAAPRKRAGSSATSRPSLRVVGGAKSAAKRVARSASKPAARRKRA